MITVPNQFNQKHKNDTFGKNSLKTFNNVQFKLVNEL